jgi:hypothetical protein
MLHSKGKPFIENYSAGHKFPRSSEITALLPDCQYLLSDFILAQFTTSHQVSPSLVFIAFSPFYLMAVT